MASMSIVMLVTGFGLNGAEDAALTAPCICIAFISDAVSHIHDSYIGYREYEICIHFGWANDDAAKLAQGRSTPAPLRWSGASSIDRGSPAFSSYSRPSRGWPTSSRRRQWPASHCASWLGCWR